MNKNPLFSVIIPVKGRLEYTKEAINSILNQKNIDIDKVEIIVVENEKASEIIRDKVNNLYPEVKIVINKFEDYAGGSRNSGLEAALGKYIVFLDSDDQLKPDFLAESSKMLDQDKNSSATVCFSSTIFEPEYKIKEKIKWILLMIIRDVNLLISYFLNNKYLFRSAFYLCQISHMMFKKEKIRNMKFDYQYRFGGEDWDFINRVQNKGNVRIIPKKLTTFRYSTNSTTVRPKYKKLKWQSYLMLVSKLPPKLKEGEYYRLFLKYIDLFRVMDNPQ